MIKLLATVALCLFFGSAISQFEQRLSVPGSFFLEDVTYADSNTVLVSGSNYFGTTINNEKSWRAVNYGGMSVKSTCFPSVNFGIGVGNDGKYRTNTDCAYYWGWSGTNYVGINRDLADVHFITDDRGIVCGELGAVLTTSDQGSNWNNIASGTSAFLNGVYMINDSLSFVCGDGGVLIQLDHDTVFSSQVLGMGIDLKKIQFITDSIGFIVGTQGTMYKTTDQGNTWNSVTLGTSVDLLNIDFNNVNHGAVCGANSTILITSDGGTNWTSAQFATTGDIRAVAFENDLKGYAVGQNFVMYTSDGGLSWARIDGEMQSVHFPTADKGYACGYRGVAHKTEDGGNTWQPMNLNTIQYLNDIFFVNADTGYCVGGSSVFRTHDAGETWTSISNPSTSSLYAVYFSDYNHGVAMGYKSTLLYTNDAGATWQHSYSFSSTIYYRDVQFTNALTGYFCTSNGFVHKTTDGGINWTAQTTGGTGHLTNLHFVNDTVGWAVGGNGRIIKTTDGGVNWTTQNSGVTQWLNGVHFISSDTGFVVGHDGTYLITYNGGNTWIDHTSGYADYTQVFFSSNGTGFATSPGSVHAIGPFTQASTLFARCAGSALSYNTFRPYFDNDDTVSTVVEITRENDDYSNAIIVQNMTVDSLGMVNFVFPDTLSEGIYKTRIRDINDPTNVSLDKFHKVIRPPQLSLTLVDTMLIVTSNEQVTYQWWYRPDAQSFPSYLGNNDTLHLTTTGEYYVNATSQCCDAKIDWMAVGMCNGLYVLESDFLFTSHDTICSGDSIQVNGNFYSQSGTYYDTLTNIQNCDSIIVTILHVEEYLMPTTYLTICENDTVAFGNGSYFQSGIYIDTLSSVNGCDSVLTLDLTVLPADTVVIDSSVCFGNTVTLDGTVFSTTGSHYHILTSSNGCDSTVLLNLTVFGLDTNSVYTTICFGDSVQIGASTYHQTGSYADTLSNINGCDSIINLFLTVLQPDSITLNTSICYGDSIEMGGSFYSASGTYQANLLNISGCDSIVTLNLSVWPLDTMTIDSTVCAGNSVQIGSSVYLLSGTYYDTLLNANGCDSIVKLILQVLPPNTISQNATICSGDTLLVGTSQYTVSGTYQDTVLNTSGCMEIVTTSLSVLATPMVNLGADTLICENTTIILDAGNGYDAYLWNTLDTTQTIVVSDSGVYFVTVTDANGCSGLDSIHVDVNDCMSVSDMQSLGIQIYPNPSNGTFFIAATDETLSAEIYNSMGVLVQYVDLQSGIQEINLMVSGIYFIKFHKSGMFQGSYNIIVTDM